MSDIVKRVQYVCKWGASSSEYKGEIVEEVVLLAEMREGLRNFIAQYETTPVSHRPTKGEIMAKLKEIAGE